jgi:hypothetical protein
LDHAISEIAIGTKLGTDAVIVTDTWTNDSLPSLRWRKLPDGTSILCMKRADSTASLADQMLDLAAGCFDAPTLNALSRLRLNPKMEARVKRLAGKANEGELTPRERAEYQSYIKTSELLTLIQLRARLKLQLPIPAE